MSDGSFVRHIGFGSQETTHTCGIVVRGASRMERRSLVTTYRRQLLLSPKLAKELKRSRSVPRVMIVRKRQNHDASLVNFPYQSGALEEFSLRSMPENPEDQLQ